MFLISLIDFLVSYLFFFVFCAVLLYVFTFTYDRRKNSFYICISKKFSNVYQFCSQWNFGVFFQYLFNFINLKGRSFTDAIFMVQQIIEKRKEHNLPLFLLFIDYEKAYENMHRDKL